MSCWRGSRRGSSTASRASTASSTTSVANRPRRSSGNDEIARASESTMSRTFLASLLVLALLTLPAFAERPPEMKESATHVFTGTIKALDVKDTPFGKDGKQSNYTAEI